MKILVIGSGGREHALAWALSRSGDHSLICAPGNPGMAEIGEIFPVETSDTEGLVTLARKEMVDLVLVGPEAPLVAGLADELRMEGFPCFGPGKDAAMLEGSKWFAKEIMKSAGVPTAKGKIFTDKSSALEYLGRNANRYVLKADGLAAGKGVFLPDDSDEAGSILDNLFEGKPGEHGIRVIIEDRLQGNEVSILAICSGTECVILPPSRDHKRLGDGDTGPNTGGMGAVCPPPGIDSDLCEIARVQIVQPVLAELASRGIDYRGVLYAGLMITEEGPRVLEFNVRFGDPETQAVLPLLESDLAELCYSAALGSSLPASLKVRNGACTCVVLASGGYPVSYEKGYSIEGIEDVNDAYVFQAGTSLSENGIVTSGGRVLGVSALGDSLEESIETAYRELDKISFTDSYFRKDIGG